MMPTELERVPEETTVVGDIDAIISYIESGKCVADWDYLCDRATKWIDATF